MSQCDLFDTPAKSKAASNGQQVPRHRITCRVIEIDEAKLVKVLGIHNPKGAAYSAWRRLSRRNPDLTPRDIACAIREVRLMAELWVDAVAAELDRLAPHSLRRPTYQHRRRRLTWRQPSARRRIPSIRPSVPAAIPAASPTE
jgi:hypothetical protein